MRAGFDAIRRGAGDDAFLLGCGAPIGARRRASSTACASAPTWRRGGTRSPTSTGPPGHTGGEPATVNAWRNTLSRSFLHRRLWLNDPDCLMLRTDRTKLEPEQMRAWALAVGVSGGMALVSDDLALLGRRARALLDEVVALGRGGRRRRAPAAVPRPAGRRPADAARDRHGRAGRRPGAGLAHVQGLLSRRRSLAPALTQGPDQARRADGALARLAPQREHAAGRLVESSLVERPSRTASTRPWWRTSTWSPWFTSTASAPAPIAMAGATSKP